MPSYKCCQCYNILTSQGPIFALFQNEQGQASLRLSFEDSARISDASLFDMSSLAADSDSKAFTVTSEEPLKGTLGNFKISDASVTLSSDGGVQKARQTITLCCSNCNHCCEYKTNS